MAQENEKLNRILRKAAAEKLGAGELFDQVEKVGPLLKKLEGVDQLMRGDEGYTPQKGTDYFTEEEKQDFLDAIRPIKGVDYMDGEPGKTPIKGIDYMTEEEMAQVIKDATPVKGQHYFTEQEVADFKAAVTPKKGVDYNDGKDGKNPSVSEFLDEVINLKGAAAANFSKKIGAVIDISHIRNASAFIFNGKKYGVEELMHGGGSGGGSGSVTSVAASGGTTGMTFSGSPITTSGTLTLGGTLNIANGGTGQTTANGALNALLPSQGGNNGKFLTTDGSNTSWASVAGSGTVTTVSVVSANGFAGTVANATTTPAITLTTTITGILKGNGTAISAATAGTDYQAPITLTTTGTSGAATFVGNTLNIPQYQAAGSYVPTTRTLTINGSAQDLSADRTWTITTTGTTDRISVTGGTGLTPTIDIAATYVGQTSITTLGTIATGTWSATTIAVNKGGTGQTTYTDGQLLIGNSTGNTLTKATLTAGSGISITNGSGAITIASTALTTLTVGTTTITSGTTTRVLYDNAGVLGEYTISGSGSVAMTTSPSFTTPTLGVASATSINKVAITAPATSATLTIADGKTATFNNSITFAGTDSTTMTFPTTSKTIAANDGSNWTFTSQAIGDLPYASSTTAYTRLAAVATGSVLVSQGTGTAPAWSANPQLTTIELGNASDTTLSRSSAGVLAVEGVVVPTISSTNTLTNKRVTRRLTTTNAPGATPATNTDNVDIMNFTGLNTAITSMTTNLSGTPNDGDLLEFRFLDDGTARAITWGTSFASTTVTLPTTTVISTCLRVLFEWRAASSKWECVATC